MRTVAIAASLYVLSACGANDGPPMFSREPGLWRSETQMLSLASVLASPAQMAAMPPEQAAAFRNATSQPRELNAPVCVTTPGVLAASQIDLAPIGIVTNGACSITRQESSDTGFTIEGICSVDGIDTPTRVDGTFTATQISKTFVLSRPPVPNAPPNDHRVKLTETRTGDCT